MNEGVGIIRSTGVARTETNCSLFGCALSLLDARVESILFKFKLKENPGPRSKRNLHVDVPKSPTTVLTIVT